jgi:hypothetical protein
MNHRTVPVEQIDKGSSSRRAVPFGGYLSDRLWTDREWAMKEEGLADVH